MKMSLRACAWSAALMLVLVSRAQAQWVEQSLDLEVGWNSIYVEVDASPLSTDVLFAGLPIEAVWMRVIPTVGGPLPVCSGPDDENPDCVPPEDTRWRVWVPESDPGRFAARDLPTLDGGHAYMVLASAPTILTIVGTPSPLAQQWSVGFNFAGFHVDPGAPPTISAYLEASDIHSASGRVFERLADGSLAEIADPSTEVIVPGKGYWVAATADGEYDGPLSIDPVSRNGVSFARRQTEHPLEIQNRSSTLRNVSVGFLPSADVPPVPIDLPEDGGDTPVVFLDGPVSERDPIFIWTELALTPYAKEFAPFGEAGATRTVPLGVNRASAGEGLVTLDPSDDGVASILQGLLSISDGAGYRRLLPVTAEVPPQAGLWVAQVTVNEVTWTTAGAPTWTNPESLTCGCDQGICQSTVDGALDGAQCSFCDESENGLCTGQITVCANNPSQTCNTNFDCAGGASCVSAFACVGGTEAGSICLTDNDCLGDPAICLRVVDASVCACPEPELIESTEDPDCLRPTGSTFTFPAIVHFGVDGATLLTEAEMRFEPTEPGSTIGRFILVTPACQNCDGLTAGNISAGEQFAPRISTAAYAFDGDLPMGLSGDFGEGGTMLTTTITMAGDHPLNPFKHKFHPDHDCVDKDGNPQVGECYKITRTMKFLFGAEELPGGASPDFGFTAVSGTYLERITISATPNLVGPCECAEVMICQLDNETFCEVDTDCAPGDVCVAASKCVNEADPPTPGTCTDVGDCNCAAVTCFCESGTCVGGVNAGVPCQGDGDCGCGDEELFTTMAAGTFSMVRVSDIDKLNDVTGG